MKVRIYSDGGARGNPGPAAIGVLICDEKGNTLKEHQEVIGEATNNIAEYKAVIAGLKLAKQLGVREVQHFVDSELVAHQLSGKYRVKTPHIRDLFMEVRNAEKAFSQVRFSQIPRTHEKICRVDKLVNQALNREGY